MDLKAFQSVKKLLMHMLLLEVSVTLRLHSKHLREVSWLFWLRKGEARAVWVLVCVSFLIPDPTFSLKSYTRANN